MISGLQADLVELGTQGVADHEEAQAELALALRYAQDYDYTQAVVHADRAHVLLRRLKKTAKKAHSIGQILEARGGSSSLLQERARQDEVVNALLHGEP